mmetsp:Transcript_25869/g.40141  ORF Transcript_25869/g.40141 Transcript_25869/m.40141 type:complete len:395 (+) Transcript_25869:2-1186(+)
MASSSRRRHTEHIPAAASIQSSQANPSSASNSASSSSNGDRIIRNLSIICNNAATRTKLIVFLCSVFCYVIILFYDFDHQYSLPSSSSSTVISSLQPVNIALTPLQVLTMENERARQALLEREQVYAEKNRLRQQQRKEAAAARAEQIKFEKDRKEKSKEEKERDRQQQQQQKSVEDQPFETTNPQLDNKNTKKTTTNTRLLKFLFRISSFWAFVLFCMTILRALVRRYVRLSGFNPSPFPGRRGANGGRGGMLASIRRARFEALAQRLNAERTANGAPPISRETLALALSNRDFNGNDYDNLLRLNEENGAALLNSLGATDEEINRNPTHVITAEILAGLEGGKKNCSVCLEEYVVGDVVRTIPCFHSFHATCVDEWLKNKAICPVCKHSAFG